MPTGAGGVRLCSFPTELTQEQVRTPVLVGWSAGYDMVQTISTVLVVVMTLGPRC